MGLIETARRCQRSGKRESRQTLAEMCSGAVHRHGRVMRLLIVFIYWQVVILMLLGPGAHALGEVKAAAQEGVEKSTETVKLSAREVMVPVTVRDKSGKLVSGLGKEDFQLFEDGRPQRLTVLQRGRCP